MIMIEIAFKKLIRIYWEDRGLAFISIAFHSVPCRFGSFTWISILENIIKERVLLFYGPLSTKL